MTARVPTYEEDIEHCKRFLQEFQSSSGTSGITFKYGTQMQEIVNRERDVLEIDIDDVYEFGSNDLADNVLKNTKRYVNLFAEACDDLSKDIPITNEAAERTPLDTYIQYRISLRDRNQGEGAAPVDTRPRYPPSLLRRYTVVFRPPFTQKARSIRQVDAKDIGSLVTVEGIVTRATAVKPLVTVATYSCDSCTTETYQEVMGPNFMPLTTCGSDLCQTNKRKGHLTLQTRGSKFVRFQELKIQEMAKHVPTGHIPRTMTVHVYGPNTRAAFPGDEVTLTGIFLPVPYTGYRAIRAGLLSETYLEAQIITKKKKTYVEQTLSPEIIEEITTTALEPEMYDQLASSIAPEIYGHDDVKKALLLLLVGGTDRELADGMKIRGDINVCLMGDPGVAKSQLLKKVADLAPRGVYTTGRGSSGVGLTAAVTRDPITKELVLEGGALVLADMGVCCIDEFDKMEEGDRTAIHEVMEQQTISIAKAGITTTLNARAAILAAANPAYGRYNIKRSPTQNINLPAALLSRFDLMFLLLDRPDIDADLRLARHITYVHAHNDFPVDEREPLDKEFLRNYVAYAKTFQPFIGPELTDHITGVYAKIREDQEENVDDTHITARTLLAILRLSTALAKLRFTEEVELGDFEEALRLMHSSKASVLEAKETQRKRKDPIKDIYKMITDLKNRHDAPELRMSDLERVVSTKGYGVQDLEKCIAEYEDLNVWMRTGDGRRLKFI
eukprot:m.66197 g.66197  ORF g.66197 m.66197 type:complete len:728 (-) comp13580_c1_seq2:66-2249(-)